MARGKHLSLEEARKLGKLDQFAKEHSVTGDMDVFDALLGRMAPRETGPARRAIHDMSPALTALEKLRAFDGPDLTEALDHLVKTGAPLFIGKVKAPAAEATGEVVIVHEIADELKVFLAAMEARN